MHPGFWGHFIKYERHHTSIYWIVFRNGAIFSMKRDFFDERQVFGGTRLIFISGICGIFHRFPKLEILKTCFILLAIMTKTKETLVTAFALFSLFLGCSSGVPRGGKLDLTAFFGVAIGRTLVAGHLGVPSIGRTDPPFGYSGACQIAGYGL